MQSKCHSFTIVMSRCIEKNIKYNPLTHWIPPAPFGVYNYDRSKLPGIWNDPSRENKPLPFEYCMYCGFVFQETARTGRKRKLHLVCNYCRYVKCHSCGIKTERDTNSPVQQMIWSETRSLRSFTDVCLVCRYQVVKELNKKTGIEPISQLIVSCLTDTSESSFFIDKLFTNPNNQQTNHATSSIDQET